MINVPEVAAAPAWYTAIGFTEVGRVGDEHGLNWAIVSFGQARIMLNVHTTTGRQPVSLWFYTDQVDELYKLFKVRQLDAARAAAIGGTPSAPIIEFVEEIHGSSPIPNLTNPPASIPPHQSPPHQSPLHQSPIPNPQSPSEALMTRFHRHGPQRLASQE
jgi:hypothetical protein